VTDITVRITNADIAGIASGLGAIVNAYGLYQTLAVAQALINRTEAVSCAEAVDAMLDLAAAVEDHMEKRRT
jgi:hypothetical protein